MELIAKTFDELTTNELYEILKTRAEIFVVEQKIRYVDEDNTDYEALHCFFYENHRVIAYLRAYQDPAREDAIKIGRVLSLEHGKGIGKELMKQAIVEIPKRMPCKRITMDAQKHAEGFYTKLGFETISDEYLEEGIVHVDMQLVLEND